MENIIEAICKKEGLAGRQIEALSGGQVNRVYRIDGQHVARIGRREDAYARLKRETEILRGLAGKIPVPRVLAFGQVEGVPYQIQQFVSGQKLYLAWKELAPGTQEAIAEELAGYLEILHGQSFPEFGYGREDTQPFATWSAFLMDKLKRTLDELSDLKIRMVPGFVEMVEQAFAEHGQALEGGSACLVHGDLTLVNILVDRGKITALLDFEYALQAPPDYELWTMEAFCLYPNDWAEVEHETFCTADFASFFRLLQKHSPETFEVPNVRERVTLYQLDATLGSYLAWRKDNLNTIPASRMAAKEFYMGRITNFLWDNGARMFFA